MLAKIPGLGFLIIIFAIGACVLEPGYYDGGPGGPPHSYGYYGYGPAYPWNTGVDVDIVNGYGHGGGYRGGYGHGGYARR